MKLAYIILWILTCADGPGTVTINADGSHRCVPPNSNTEVGTRFADETAARQNLLPGETAKMIINRPDLDDYIPPRKP